MICVRNAAAGTTDSNDCYVSVSPAKSVEIALTSTVIKRYGEHIRALASETLRELGFSGGSVSINDHAALDYCIKARIKTAVERACE